MESTQALPGAPPRALETPRVCGLCGGPARLRIAGPPAVVSCETCGLESLADLPEPEERESNYQEDYYSEETGARFLGIFELAVRFFRLQRLRAIRRRVKRATPGAILDVGCGRGDLLELFKARGWRVLGTQISRTAARAARERRGVEVVCGELPELHLAREQFDVVALFHVIEHLARPQLYLETARELLVDDGLLVVEAPDCSSPGFRALGVRSFCFDYPNHLVFFTADSLRALLERSGFTVEGISRFSLEYSPFTTLQNILNLLPGKANRLYQSFMRNLAGRKLRKSPATWLHLLLGGLLAGPAFLASLAALLAPSGNTVRFYCRKRRPT